MGTIRIVSLRRLVPAATLAATLTVAPALRAQTPQDSAAHRTWNVPIGVPKTSTTNPTTPTTSPAVPSTRAQALADTAFIREARVGNLLEVRLGNLAVKRASNAAVKQFAQQMVTDHSRMGSQWASLATRNAIPSNVMLDPAQQQSESQLSLLFGTQFDRAYMSTMVQDHQQDVATFQSRGPSAQSAEVRQLAASSLTTIEQHLTMAQQVASQVGATTVATSPTPLPSPANPGQVATSGDKVNNRNGNAVRADGDYIEGVLKEYIMEVELAQMAQQKASDPKVKQFAENMLNDFRDFRDRWANLASNNGISVPSHLLPNHQDRIDRLKNASRGQFDRVYLDIVGKNLPFIVRYFQEEGRQAHSSQVRDLVNKELPTIQQHLDRVQNLGRQLQASNSGKDKDKDRDKDRNRSVSSNNK
jgi:putative membrane protein